MRKMHYCFLPALAVLAGLCLNCSKYESEAPAEEATADYAASRATADTTDATSGRQFVRTADLKFRVQDVAQTTHTVEDLTGKHGGFITRNHLTSSVINTQTVRITADSLLRTTEYQVENNLSLRVPNQNLDSLLRELSRQVRFLDYRIVDADEVSLQLLENKLRAQRAAEADKRYEKAIDGRGGKLDERLRGESDRLALQQDADAYTIRNLSLTDQVRYSTVKLAIYQRVTRLEEKAAVPVQPAAYQPGLVAKLTEAWLDGWSIMEALLVVFTRLWALWALVGLLWLGYRKFGVRLLSK